MNVREALEINEATKCAVSRCRKKRYGMLDICQLHFRESSERRRAFAQKAVATRKKSEPSFGKPQGDAYDAWRICAHRLVRMAIKDGALPSLGTRAYSCVDCGEIATQYEHRDYARPLDVEPVCRRCNGKRGSAKWPHPGRFKFPVNGRRRT